MRHAALDIRGGASLKSRFNTKMENCDFPQDGDTPLHVAAASGHFACAAELLHYGFSPGLHNKASIRSFAITFRRMPALSHHVVDPCHSQKNKLPQDLAAEVPDHALVFMLACAAEGKQVFIPTSSMPPAPGLCCGCA